MSAPPADPPRIHLELALAPDAARRARQAIAALLPPHVPATRRDDILLMVSELVANAVLHGAAPLAVDATLAADHLRIEVSDGSAATPTFRTPGAHGGYGLRLIETIADRWGYEPTPSGKRVWTVTSWA